MRTAKLLGLSYWRTARMATALLGHAPRSSSEAFSTSGNSSRRATLKPNRGNHGTG
jgi:hypothetical protein